MTENKPEITATASGYDFTWSDYGVIIRVNRIRIGKDSAVSGEIIILNHNATIYPPTKLNFTADRTRSSLAKTLAEKKADIPWSMLIDQLCYGVQDRARRGEPVVELWTGTDVRPPRYLLEPLIVEGYPNIIFGDPSAYKSNLAIILVQILQLPWSNNPLNLRAPDKSVKCVYLDWEQDENTILWLTNVINESMGLGALSIKYRHCDVPLIDDIDQAREDIVENEAEVVIIDSLGLAAGSELKETKPALDFYRALRQLKTTSLILAHNSKDRETKQRTIYGNQYFQAQARNVWEIRKSQEQGSRELDIALFHRKPPPFHGLYKPLGFKISYRYSEEHDYDLMEIKAKDPQTVGEFLEQMGTQTRILDLLSEGSMSVKDMAEQLDTSQNNISVSLNHLKKKNKVVKLEKGVWGLAAQQSEADF